MPISIKFGPLIILSCCLFLPGVSIFYFNNVASYIKVDQLFLIKALNILLNNSAKGNSDFILTDGFLERHAGDIRNTGLMERAYLEMIRKDDNYDYDGNELLVILHRRPSFS